MFEFLRQHQLGPVICPLPFLYIGHGGPGESWCLVALVALFPYLDFPFTVTLNSHTPCLPSTVRSTRPVFITTLSPKHHFHSWRLLCILILGSSILSGPLRTSSSPGRCTPPSFASLFEPSSTRISISAVAAEYPQLDYIGHCNNQSSAHDCISPSGQNTISIG